MKELPLYRKLNLVLGIAVTVAMCAVFLLDSHDGRQVSTIRGGAGSGVAYAPDKGGPRGLLPGEKISINTADRFDLCRLPGIGDGKAQAIVAFREAHGPFKRLEQIRQVKGINAAEWAQIQAYICLNEDSN